MYILPIVWGTPEYDEAVRLRYDVLRAPLGLEYDPEQLAEEYAQFHIGAYNDSLQLVGYLNLAPVDEETYKMRQVAVAVDCQGKGIGQKLVYTSELIAKSLNKNRIILHARKTAVPFYEKLNYQLVGAEFLEVGIPHFRMEKQL